LIFDVREWSRTATRYSKDPLHRRSVELPNGTLRFQSETTLDEANHQLLIQERFDMERDGVPNSVTNSFVMRCWTADEIAAHLGTTELEQLATHPGYGENTWQDLLVGCRRKDPHRNPLRSQECERGKHE
jgi:hypothetical protein